MKIYPKDECLTFIESLGDRARDLFDKFKVWSFQTAFKLMGKTESPASHADRFMRALAWTGDTGTTFDTMSARELSGFYEWYRTVGMKRSSDAEDADESLATIA